MSDYYIAIIEERVYKCKGVSWLEAPALTVVYGYKEFKSEIECLEYCIKKNSETAFAASVEAQEQSEQIKQLK